MLVSGSVYIYIIGRFQRISTGFFKSWPRQRTHFCDLFRADKPDLHLGNQSRSLWKSWQWTFSCMFFANHNASFNCFQFTHLDDECNWFWIWLTVVTLWQTNISIFIDGLCSLASRFTGVSVGFLFTEHFRHLRKWEALAYVRGENPPLKQLYNIRYLHFLYPPVNKHSNGKSPSWIGNTSSNGGFASQLC